jgi:hypothetical protein
VLLDFASESQAHVKDLEKSRSAQTVELRKWKAHSADIRRKHNIPGPGLAWSWCKQDRVRLAGVPRTDRVRDVVDVALAVARLRNPATPLAELTQKLYVNTSQSVSRVPVSLRHPPTPTTTMSIYSYGRDSILSPRAFMRWMGWPQSLIHENFSFGELNILVGNSFSVPLSALTLAALYANPQAPWWQSS